MAKCKECGKSTIAPSIEWRHHGGKWVCPACISKLNLFKEDSADHSADHIILSTTPTLQGFEIEKYLGVESVQLVMGTGIVAEFVSDLSDFVGERSSKFENKMLMAKYYAMNRLKKQAVNMGGDAVVGIGFEYPVYSGNKMGFVAYGTVVKLKNSPVQDTRSNSENLLTT